MPATPADRPLRVLVATAAMGGGHVQVSNELARRLRERGHDVRVTDVNAGMPGGTGIALGRGYPWLVNHAPWLYETIYRTFFLAPQRAGERVLIPTLGAMRALRRQLAEYQPDLVVSTYHIAALAAARLRERGELDAPAITFVTTFGIHELWLHPACDGYLCISGPAAAVAARRQGEHAAPVRVGGPLVRRRFTDAPRSKRDQLAAKRRLGVDPSSRVALLLAGALGMGAVESAFRVAARLEGWTPVVVCGRNEALRRRLTALTALAKPGGATGIVIGWTDEMFELMQAADVVVENAAGSSAKEALALGVPVVTFRPIAGHGRDDALWMQALGVTEIARDEPAFAAALRRLADDDATRQRRISLGRSLFRSDPAEELLALAGQLDRRSANPNGRRESA